MSIFNYLLFYLICALNIIWGIKKKKSNALCFGALLIIFVLMTFNYYGPDIEVYVKTYELVGKAPSLSSAFDSTYMEQGYVVLMFLANKMSLDFYAFRIVITLICLALFMSAIKYFKVNPNFIIGLYMVHLFFFDTIQFRNFIVQFIILFAIRYLFRKSCFSMFKYIFCVAVAGSIHVVAWIYLSLLLVRFLNKQRTYNRVLALSLLIFLSSILLRPLFPQILNLISRVVNRGAGYLSNSSRISYIIVMAFYLLSLMVLYSYRNKLLVKTKINEIIKIKIVIGLFLSLCIIDGSFYRIFRNLFLLDMIGMALLYNGMKSRTKASDIVLSSQFVFVGGWLAFDLIRNSKMDIIGDIMKYNLLPGNIDVSIVLRYLSIVIILLFIIVAVKFLITARKPHKRRLICN